MTSTYTTSLRLDKQGLGDRVNTWGTLGLNAGVIDMVDRAIAGFEEINVTGPSHTLTTANATADQARSAFLAFTGNPGAILQVIAPSVSKEYIIHNRLSGGYGLTIATTGGVGVTVNNGAVAKVYTDGTDFFLVTSGPATGSGSLFVATSNTSLAIGTGPRVFTLNEADRAFGVGTRLLAVDAANPGVNTMSGYVSAYTGSSLTLVVDTTAGSGTVADWVIVVNGSATALNPPVASEAEAEAGTDNIDYMTPLRTAQAIGAQAIVGFRSISTTGPADRDDFRKVLALSNAITVTFDQAADLETGFYCYLANVGSDNVTIAAASGEDIDGASSIVMLPSETRMLYGDGTELRTLGLYVPSNVQIGTKTDTASTTSLTWVDTGVEVTITLRHPASRVRLSADVTWGSDGNNPFFKIVRDSTDVLVGDAAGDRRRAHFQGAAMQEALLIPSSGSAIDTPGSVGPHTYKIQWSIPTAGTAYLNRSQNDTDGANYGRGASTLIAEEIGA